MAKWAETRYPQQGWGETFRTMFDDDKIAVTNEAVSGWTTEDFYKNKWTKSYTKDYDPKLYPPVKDQLRAGDYLLVSYLHNDYSVYCYEKSDYYSDCKNYIVQYNSYLSKIADECKEKGINLLFVQPPNKGENYDFHSAALAGDTSGKNDFTAVMPKIATDKNIPFVNVHEWTLNQLKSNLEDTREKFYLYNLTTNKYIDPKLTEEQVNNHENSTVRQWKSDLTHININGCKEISNYVAGQLKTAMPALASYLKTAATE